jgi:hypothetical protein
MQIIYEIQLLIIATNFEQQIDRYLNELPLGWLSVFLLGIAGSFYYAIFLLPVNKLTRGMMSFTASMIVAYALFPQGVAQIAANIGILGIVILLTSTFLFTFASNWFEERTT